MKLIMQLSPVHFIPVTSKYSKPLPVPSNLRGESQISEADGSPKWQKT